MGRRATATRSTPDPGDAEQWVEHDFITTTASLWADRQGTVLTPSSASRIVWTMPRVGAAAPAPADAGRPQRDGHAGDGAVPSAGSWIRLEQIDAETNGRKVLSKWHGVRGWDDERGQVILHCTGRDRNLSWALDDGRRFVVGRSLRRPSEGAICQHCLRRASEMGEWLRAG